MYVVVVHFRIAADFVEAFRPLMLAQARNSLAEEAECHRFDVAFDPDDAASCLLYELYTDREAFEQHLQTPHFREFDAAVKDQVVSKEVSTWVLAEA